MTDINTSRAFIRQFVSASPNERNHPENDLASRILAVAEQIDSAAHWLREATQLLIAGELPDAEKTRLADQIKAVAAGKETHVADLRELARHATPEAAAKLLQAANDWHRGENVSGRLCEIAAAVLITESEQPNNGDDQGAVDTAETNGDSIPPEYREREAKDGTPMAGEWLKSRYGLESYQLTRAHNKGQLTRKIKHGRAWCYLWREIIALCEKQNTDDD